MFTLPLQIIDYNEEFLWSEQRGERSPWQQGRFGYGLYAGSVAQKFREWQFRGYPQIITELAEYFTLDGDGIRWYRWYRIAGWYAHIALWFASIAFSSLGLSLAFAFLRCLDSRAVHDVDDCFFSGLHFHCGH